MTPKKLFIVGVGRSGTSLLQAMLDSNSQIHFLPETGFIRRFVAAKDLDSTAQSGDAKDMLAKLSTDPRLARLEFEFSLLDLSQISPTHIGQHIYTRIVAEKIPAGVQYAGDKDPKCVELIDLLTTIWPNCRIIHLYRDPRDVLVSKKAAQWSRDKSIFFHLVAGHAQFKFASIAEARLSEDTFYSICYERMLESPRGILQALCRWLSIPFETSMLEFNQSAARLVSPDEMQWKGTTVGPLLRSNTNKWRTKLSALEIAATEATCNQAMQRGQYEHAGANQVKTIHRIVVLPFVLLVRISGNLFVRYRTAKNRRMISLRRPHVDPQSKP